MSAPRSRPGVLTVAVAVLSLAAIVAVRPPHAPPLYDGLGFPDEPYRWISAPAGAGTTPAATPLSLRVDLGSTEPAVAVTAEQGPQLAIRAVPDSFAAPAGSRTLTVSGAPLAAPPAPSGGTIASNLYRWTATADRPGEVRLRPGANVVVNLRADAATTQSVVLESWDGARWAQLLTRQVGVDIYAARLLDLRPIALIKLDRGLRASAAPGVAVATAPGSSAGSSGGPSAGSAGGPSAGASAGRSAEPALGAVGTGVPQQGGADGPGRGLWIGFAVVLALLVLALLAARRRVRRVQP